VTPSQSKERVNQFASGKVQLLISTTVAEEGMDVPAANCIIRFDPILTPVSLVQGRGRARQEDSSFVVMEERQDRTVANLTVAEESQKNVLSSYNSDLLESQMEENKRKLQIVRQNQERNAINFLKTAKGGTPTSIVKTFCVKSNREVVENVKQGTWGWRYSLSVLGGNEVIQVEQEAASKQNAKNEAYMILLQKLKVVFLG